MTKYSRKVIVFGDSHLGRINRKLFSSFLSKCRTRLKYFSGASTKDLEYYVTPTLIEEKPDIDFIHIDSDDIDFQQLRHNTVENIGKYILYYIYNILSILVKNVERVGFLM